LSFDSRRTSGKKICQSQEELALLDQMRK